MSDTPRTDAAAQLVRATENGVLVHANFARELERENAELLAWKESALAVEREWDAQVTAKILGARLGESCRRAIAREVPKLVVENAALREALVNADELERYSGSDGHRQWGKCSAWLNPDDAVIIISAKALDAARKEAQP